MGTLDDAIREHLELKRRSGAPDEEVKRLESEAFGPARREAPRPAEPVPAEDALPAPEAVPVDGPDLPPPPAAASPVADEEPATRIAEVTPPPPPEPPPAPERAPARSWLDDEDFGSDRTAEFSTAERREAAGEPPSDYVAPDEEGDDLLEETPDFLQETPEHDRLWFEQKPPRDFDFDN